MKLLHGIIQHLTRGRGCGAESNQQLLIQSYVCVFELHVVDFPWKQLVGVEGNDEAKLDESGVDKTSSASPSPSPRQIADPVVYKLVRVQGDGRLVPATDEEVMEVEDLLEGDKSEIRIVADDRQTVGCTSNDGSSSKNPLLDGSEGLLQSENAVVDGEKLNARLEYIEEMLQKVKQEERLRLACGSPDHSSAYMIVDWQCSDQHDKLHAFDKKLQSKIPLQETVPSSTPGLIDGHINQSGSVGECSKPLDGPVESVSSASAVCTSSKPDFSKLKGEICLDNLSIRELHETFKATFGRDTTVKDKQWLKRRIAMGLTNSCDVSTSSFIFRNNKLVKKGEEESCKSVDGTFAKDSVVGAVNDSCRDSPVSHNSEMEDRQIVSGKRLENPSMEYDCGSDDLLTEQRAAKRVRKPTRRYIEELSEVESREYSGRLLSSAKNYGQDQTSPKSRVMPVRNVSSDGRAVVTRLDSLGGSGVQVPYVSRVRRSRPRKNVMSLMRFHPSGTGMAAKLVKKALGVRNSQRDNESGGEVLIARSASQHFQQPLTTAPGKDALSGTGMVELEQKVELKHTDSSGDTSDDNIVTVPTAKGGMRRKHHRAWTLGEVMKLVDGVSMYGAGRWSEIKRLAFASISYRTSVDLKDKWRNLLRASFAQTPPEKGMNSRKHASMPIPASILLRVRELAKMHAQVPPNLSSSKLASCGGRSVYETRSGYL
ncbi:hypothetical protein L1049_004714 [Liquidambar formosana]|uniref:Uncharacterized protein n=1 Tax=Liquidambar formosana TaxID=63359 RepID=A0AAP0RPG2_LIQFO